MRKITLLLLIILSLLVVGCSKEVRDGKNGTEPEPVRVEFFAMDTFMWISAFGANADAGIERAVQEITRLESLWSVSVSESEISQINRTGSARVSEDTKNVIDTAIGISKAADYAFDITIYPVVKAWGFTTAKHRVPDENELADMIKLVDSDMITSVGDTITLEAGMELDLGAIAKGYASARAIDILRQSGITSAIVSLGGNIQTLGTKPDASPWNVAVQDPIDLNSYIGTLKIADKAAVTSGVYQRYFERDGKVYHHLIDPKSGKPADNGLLSVTIISDDGALADALATAMFIKGIDAATDFWRSDVYAFDMILINSDEEIFITDGISDAFTLLNAQLDVTEIRK